MKADFKVIDAEMHLQEPVDFFQRRLPEPYRSQFKVTPPPSGFRVGPKADQVLDDMLARQGLSYARGLAPSTHHVWIEGKLVERDSDLAALYRGTLSLEAAPIGGLRAVLELPGDVT